MRRQSIRNKDFSEPISPWQDVSHLLICLPLKPSERHLGTVRFNGKDVTRQD